MGAGASSKQSDGKASENSHKTIALASAEGHALRQDSHECHALSRLEDEVRWLRIKVEQEKREKEWTMSRSTICNHQASSSSSCATTASAAPVATVNPEEDLIWLRRAVDAEKAEKGWLMARFEVLEARLKTRNEECSNLRAQLLAGQTGQAAPAQEQPEHRSSVGFSLPGTPAVMDPYSPSELNRSPSAGSLSLKERRGLKLGVTTQYKEGVPTKALSQQVEQRPAPVLSAKVTEPHTAPVTANRRSTFGSNNPVEPESPLLARRKSAEKFPRVAAKVEVQPASPSISPTLKVDAFKVSQLEEDCPASPKRKKRVNTFHGDGETGGMLRQISEDAEDSPRPRITSSYF